MIKLVVFDFDGTLVDSKKTIFNTILDEIEGAGFVLPKGFIKKMGKVPLLPHLHDLEIAEKEIKVLATRINDKFVDLSQNLKETRGFKDVQKIKLPKAIITNNVSEYVKKFLSSKKISYFSEIYGADMVKNKEEAFHKLMKKYGVSKREVLSVGDNSKDVIVAHNVGCWIASVSNRASWSTRKEIEAEKPDFIIKSLSDVAGVIDKINKINKK